MIFRKPYGFLIKHFRMIHLILTALSIYLVMKVQGLLRYYNQFIEGTASKLDAMSYVTNYYMIAIVLSIIVCLIIYALMRYKKKPRVLYLMLIVLYFAIAVMVSVVYEGLYTIYISVLDVKTLRLYRDLLQILVWGEYLAIILVLIRGLGFDIKKFDFVKDLSDLGLAAEDAEEVELTLGGTEVTQRKFHRGLRELKYYYLENKLFIFVIVVVVLLVGGSTFFVDKQVIHKVYEEGETFASSNFRFCVLNTYVTNRDYKGAYIGDLDHSFVVVRMKIGATGGETSLNLANMILKTEANGYVSEGRYADRFVDLGTFYRGQNLRDAGIYLFVYSVLNEELDQKMKLVYAEDKVVHIQPVSLDQELESVTLKLGSSLDLAKTSMNEGFMKISSYAIQERFSYSYDYEVRGESFTGSFLISSHQNVILHLKMEGKYLGSFSNYSFLKNYAKLKYKVGEQEYEALTFSDKTPGNYKDGLYLAVDKRLQEATSIWLDIMVRNKRYLYIIK